MILRDELGRKKYCIRGHYRDSKNLRKNGACKQCERLFSNNRQKEWSKNNPEKRKIIRNRYRKNANLKNPLLVKNWDLKKKYGISVQEYNQLVSLQKGQCAICDKITKLSVDNNHRNNKIRGLLCPNCNLLLGHSKEDKHILSRAIEYLEKPSD